MKCFQCVVELAGKEDFTSRIKDAVTAFNGTALCPKHAMEAAVKESKPLRKA